jgi:hypothetical protein
MPYIRALQMHSAAHVEYANTLSIMAFRGLNWGCTGQILRSLEMALRGRGSRSKMAHPTPENSTESTVPATGANPADESMNKDTPKRPREYGGPKGLEPTRYGDWERKGRCVDF